MKSRYNGLRTIGTLALILAWVVLILGIVFGVATWLGLGAFQNALDLPLGPLPIIGVIPGVLWGILGFLVYYAIGKTLHLLVDVDERTMQVRLAVEQPAAAEDSGAEMSGELKRQAKLIAANLEATQDIQRQLAAIESKVGVSPAVAPAAAIAAGAAVAVAAAADDTADAAADAGDDVATAVEEAANDTDAAA